MHVVMLLLQPSGLKVSVQALGMKLCTQNISSHSKDIYIYSGSDHIWCRFLATEESNAHPIYKRKLVEYQQTEYTNIFGRARWPNAPQRVLRTPFFTTWRSLPEHVNEADQPVIGHTTIHGVVRSSEAHFESTVSSVCSYFACFFFFYDRRKRSGSLLEQCRTRLRQGTWRAW